MKKPILFTMAVCLTGIFMLNAQVQINKQLQMTGSGTDAKITGIQSVTGANDAANVGSIQTGNFIYALSTGSSNSFALNISPAIGSYQTGMVFNFISGQTVTGVSTLNVNSLGAKTIKKNVSQDLSGCEIQTGQAVSVLYDGLNFQMISYPNQLSPPSAPVASAATNGALTQFTANWNVSLSATGYYLDVSAVSNFATCLPGDSNLNVGNVLTYTVTGLSLGTYYYRVRAFNACSTSSNSNTITAVVAITQTECSTTYAYNTVTTGTGRTWLDRNLGASEVATSSTDFNAYGSIFEWGRLADGHECISWSGSTSGGPVQTATTTLSPTDVPPNALYISGANNSGNDYDWRTTPNDNLWQGVNGTNNPCPSGFRIPTAAEWTAEIASWSSTDINGAFGSPLKLTMPGVRQGVNSGAALQQIGTVGEYYASDATYDGGLQAYQLYVESGAAGTEHPEEYRAKCSLY